MEFSLIRKSVGWTRVIALATLLLVATRVSESYAQEDQGTIMVTFSGPEGEPREWEIDQRVVHPVKSNQGQERQQNTTDPENVMNQQPIIVDQLHSEDLVNTLLSAAVLGDIMTVRQIILDQGVSPEVKNALQWTPLNLAALAGQLGVIRFLILEASANRETKEIYGQTPLGSAAINGHVDVVRFLLNLDPPANVSATDLDGATPLHYAAQFGYVEVVKSLIEKGAGVNMAVGQNGWTPLHAAAAAGQVDVVRILLNRGADKEKTDFQGNKPVQIIGLTLNVTKRKKRRIKCLLDPGQVFGGCGKNDSESMEGETTPDAEPTVSRTSQEVPPPSNPENIVGSNEGQTVEFTNGSDLGATGG
ncbi:hypothetical protein BSKO_07032 [Bryopsis sp. KO-2023]|nr:hypothetical protein BSKO_07032 [Bryopsis sp. KO-2023]